MKTKIFQILLIIISTLSLISCSNSDSDSESVSNTATQGEIELLSKLTGTEITIEL